ncbi:MAG: hypothetical protein ABEH90_06905 [Halolamina sp.]
MSVTVSRDRLHRQAGAQLLLPLPSMSTGIAELPAEACRNLLIVSPWAPSQVESALRERGVALNGCGLIPVSSSPVRYDGPLWTTDPVAPSDLTGLSIRYSQAMRHVEPDAGWVLIDNAQVLLMYAEARRVCRLLDQLTAQAKERDVTGVVAVDREAVQDGTLSKLQATVDRPVER